ncbi:MAG: ArnT family glycosyltransferase [Bacteroidia bacterium]
MKNLTVELNKSFYIIFFIIFSIISLLLIEKYQTPWFDEVFFADVSMDFLKNHTFFCREDAIRTSHEVLIYGPIYFVLSSFSFTVLGFGMWQFRLLGLVSGLIVLYIFLEKTAKYTNSKYALLFLLFLITDRVFNFSIHSGRMDMLAVLFLTIAVLILCERKGNQYIRSFVAGFFLALAGLTTIRILLFLPFLVLLPLFEQNNKTRLKLLYQLTFAAITLIVIYLMWVYYAFGSIGSMIDYIKSMPVLNQHFSGFPGNIYNKIFRKVYEIPKFLLFYISVIYLIRRKAYRDLFISFVVLLSFGFILFVDEVGPYRAMIFPFLYFVIVYASYDFFKMSKNKWIKNTLIIFVIGILVTNLILISARYVVIFANWNVTSSEILEKKVISLIPKNAKVFGDYKYYYACKKQNANFISNSNMNQKKRDFVEKVFRPDYIIVSKDDNFVNMGVKKTIIPMYSDNHYFFPISLIVMEESLLDEMCYGGVITKFD